MYIVHTIYIYIRANATSHGHVDGHSSVICMIQCGVSAQISGYLYFPESSHIFYSFYGLFRLVKINK